ncbi:MAG: pyridoxal phosphate-dependent aminotransferase [Chloroflexi bacterium]|nr:pyridoxal phosphate-dependent aminotransferase [Chloroflexota bacterium]
MRFADRVGSVTESATLAVSNKARAMARQGIDVVDLGGGDPDFITPAHIRAAAEQAMNAGDTHYVNSRGTPELLAALADKLRRENGLVYDAATEILVAPGGKQAIYETVMALVGPGDEVIIPEPAWVSYVPCVQLAGATPVPVNLPADDNWTLTRDLLAAAVTPRSRLIIINSPSNPTGHVLRPAELQAIADVAAAHDLLVLADEIYEHLLFNGHHHTSFGTLPGMADRTLTVNGFSKSYAMTGWRVGYVAARREIISQIFKVHSHSVTCATSFAQAGAVAALTGPQECIAEMLAAYARRRALVTDGFNAISGLACPPIEGAFYAFVDVRGTGLDSATFAARLLDEAHVAVTPGVAFGAAGEGFVRLSFANSDELLEKAVERTARMLRGVTAAV